MDADAPATTTHDGPAAAFASAFEQAFQQVYLRFHRRDGRRSELPNASRAVLLHLAQSGPLTVTEAARHLDRAQSVVSEIVGHLERKGLLEREADPADRRRTLVWLTPAGFAELERDARVLSADLLRQAADRLDARTRAALLAGLAALLDAERAAHAEQAAQAAHAECSAHTRRPPAAAPDRRVRPSEGERP